MTKRIFTVLLLLVNVSIHSQERASLSLEEAYALIKKNYPLADKKQLLENISNINLKILDKERLPQLGINGLGQLQSENVQIGEPGSPVSVDVPLESYRAYIDANYNLIDGGMIKAQKNIERASLKVNQQSLQVSLRSLKDRVNNLFFAIQLSRQQKLLLATSINDIETNIQTLEVGFENGTVLESEVSKLKVRRLELKSESTRLEGDIQGYFEVLNELLGSNFSNAAVLILPNDINNIQVLDITRPEQLLYDYQEELFTAQEATIDATRMPKVSLFAESGVGYPNPLNFSDISSSTYALGGLRLSWDFFDWGKSKKEKEKLSVQIQQVQVDKQTFEKDIISKRGEYKQKIKALEKQLINDLEIVTLQKEILYQSQVQLKEGVINSSDYLTQVNAELAARQEQELHKVQLKQLQIEYLTLFGKL